MKKHVNEIRDRASSESGDGIRVNPAGRICPVTPPQIGVVPIERTMQKPQAYKPTKGAQ